ncbi:MAG: clostripain-related cysteine peptidase [Eubacteriales bacterium]|nr:clostripain-related cysteine peptidase [Eubacteriales bacterium]
MKHVFIYFMIAALLLSAAGLTGCGGDAGPEAEENSGESLGSGDEESAGTEGEGAGKSKGLFMQVDKATGSMLIRRPEQKGSASMGEKGSWTIFVYLCGTDLESRLFWGGSATGDLREMQAATANSQIRYVIQTGGTSLWHNLSVDDDASQRFVIEDGELVKVDEGSLMNMGKSSTLADFLKWGVQNFSADKMGVVLWNHGGGSIEGVCFDENEDWDSLSLRELDAAFLSVYKTMTDKFEFIGMDACLMGTVETANIAASYARYMIASEENEPGGGWDYEEIGNYLAANPEADGAELGKIVCDSYLESCREADDDAGATLSVIDLDKMDTVVESFNTFAKSMYEASEDSRTLSEMSRKIIKADNFGGNNKNDGYTNMVDLGGLLQACAGHTSGSKEAQAALKDSVVYSVHGSDHPDATGLSIYYPLEVQGQEELTTFESVCLSPYYLSFVDRKTQGFVSSGEEYEYDDDTWFLDGLWSWLTDYTEDEEGDYEYEEEDPSEGYWSYVSGHEVTGESPYITFEEEPGLDEDGTYYFVLDDEGYENASDVSAQVYTLTEDGNDYIEIGETYDLQGDWDEGYFADAFDGYWLSLPDGQNLATYIVDTTDDYIIYSAPILHNDEQTNLRLRQTYDGDVTVEGTWEGIGENGAASRRIVKIEEGDTIVPLYYSPEWDEKEDMYLGEEYTVTGKIKVNYSLLDENAYMYTFCIDDLYGDYYMTDPVIFYVYENGDVVFE